MQLLFLNPIKEGFIGIILTLDTLIYWLIGKAFRIFMALAGARLLSSDAYTEVANKIYAIIGVLMLFVLAYAMLRGIIDPDQSLKGEMGPKMIKRIIIAVVGLAIVPVLFNVIYQGQNLFLEHDVLAKLFFRGNSNLKLSASDTSVTIGDQTVNVDSSITVDDKVKEIGGDVTATSLWQAFFYPAEDSGLTADEIVADPSTYFVKGGAYFTACAGFAVAAAATWEIPVVGWLLVGAAAVSCLSGVSNTVAGVEGVRLTDGKKITLSEAYAMAASQGTFGIFTVFLDNYADEGEITYLFGLSTIAGAFALYAFVSFSIDMGIRAAKLAYYQIIAPVPLIMQVLPNFKSNFDQFVKSVISTFMEVFIRISVVYIVVYIICHLTEMFSSVEALWGNQDLTGVETMLALALLILGLIAFARSAPKFITDSLGIKSGDMKLGIGKKFAEGGGFAAKAIASSGIRSAAQNWNRQKGKEDPNARGWDRAQNYAKRFGSALAGFGSASARSAYDQFGPGEKHKMAMDNEQAKRVSGNAVNAAYDAGEKRAERQAQLAAALERLEAAEADEAAKLSTLESKQLDLATAIAAYNAARGTPGEAAALAAKNAAQAAKDTAEAEYNAAVEAVNKARKATLESTAIGSAVADGYRRATAWATGTVDLSREEADLKFVAALDDLKSKTREEAYKKDYITQQYRDLYENLKKKEVSRYRAGWDETSYNAEIRRLIEPQLTALSTAQADEAAARSALDAARASGADNATIASLTSDLNNKTLATRNAQSSLETARQAATLQVDTYARLSDAEFRLEQEKLQNEIESARRTMEAAADAWVSQNMASNGNLKNMAQGLASQFSDYLAKNADHEITVGFDDHGRPIRKAVSELVQTLGKNITVDGRVDFNGIINQNDFEFEGHFYKRKTEMRDGKAVDLGFEDENGNVTRSEEFFQHIFDVMARDRSKEIKTKTGVSVAADLGKDAKNAIPIDPEFIRKKTVQRDLEQNKKGGK